MTISKAIENVVKLRQIVSVKDKAFGAKGDGTTDDTAATAAACAYIMTTGQSLFYPAGTYPCTATNVMGNTLATQTTPVHICGEGFASILKVTTAGVLGLFTIKGPNPDSTGHGNQHDGRVYIHDLLLAGPGYWGGAKSGYGIYAYGVQGVAIRQVYARGWASAIFLQNTDLVDVSENYLTYNDYGVNSANSTIPASGVQNSNNFHNNLSISGNSAVGINYFGGISPVFRDNNFTANGTSIALSTPVNAVTTNPVIEGNYFENDSSNMIVLGNAGQVRGGSIRNNTMMRALAAPAIILVNNISNGSGYPGGRCRIMDNNMSDVGGGVTSGANQISILSAEEPDYNGMNGTLYEQGSELAFAHGGVLAGGSVNLFKVGTAAAYLGGTMTVQATSAGIVTVKTYALSVIGGGATINPVTAAQTQNYSGGASAFHLVDTQDTPVVGTNTLSLVNDSAATCTFNITMNINTIIGTLTML